jgi:hypothetical protein
MVNALFTLTLFNNNQVQFYEQKEFEKGDFQATRKSRSVHNIIIEKVKRKKCQTRR